MMRSSAGEPARNLLPCCQSQCFVHACSLQRQLKVCPPTHPCCLQRQLKVCPPTHPGCPQAMGDKGLGDAVEGEADDARTRRLKLIAAVEGDDWSAVIEQQTAETTVVSLGADGEVSGSVYGRQDWQGWLAGWQGSLFRHRRCCRCGA